MSIPIECACGKSPQVPAEFPGTRALLRSKWAGGHAVMVVLLGALALLALNGLTWADNAPVGKLDPEETEPQTIPAVFEGRIAANKAKALEKAGGNKASEAAVAAGLRFLALHQAPDGHWSLDDFQSDARTEPLPAGKRVGDNSQPMTKRKNDTAGTAFGLLPFLAAGITHKPPAKAKQPDYSKGVGLAIEYLMKRQSKEKADRGNFGGDMYSHGIATIALCEAYGMTADPRIKTAAQLGLDYIIGAQDPAGGGWRYTPRKPGDTSITGWQLMALKSGQMVGLTVPRVVLKKVEKYLDACETTNKGGYGYMPSTGESQAMTAVGALCREYLGVNPRNASLLSSIQRIRTHAPGSGSDDL